MIKRSILLLIISVLSLSGCAVNPVTGKNELALVGESSEINMGNKQYAPSRQMQGGDYNTEPVVANYIKEVGAKLAAVSDRKLPYEFNVINDSTPNAWALPGGKIVINRGLLVELQSEAELAAVLGHEIVHAAARHGAKGMERGMLLQGAIMAAGIASQNSEYSQLAIGAAGIGAQLISQKYGRSAEYEADYYGMLYMSRAGYDPAAAIKLQQTFVRLSASRNTNWLEGLFASHPPSQERVSANRRTTAQLPQGGVIGRERYLQAIAPLLRDRQAYKDYDAGRKALSAGKATEALSLVNRALQQQPREALFHSLRGDIRMQQKRYRDAESNYSRALDRDSSYFHYYLQRGLARLQLNQTSAGRTDLERSLKLLPTAPALNALGQMALTTGERAKAKQYFSSAAGSNTTAGEAAKRSLIRLDLPDNPNKYLQLKFGLDKNGYLLVQVGNATTETIDQISLALRVVDAAGRNKTTQTMLPGYLAGNKTKVLSTGIGPLKNVKNVQGKIMQARVRESL